MSRAPERRSEGQSGTPSAFEVVSQFIDALSARDVETMGSLHAEDYVLDWVYSDAFASPPRPAEESAAFLPTWFVGFDEMDYEVKRTIAAEDVAVTEWVFTGTNTGPLGPPVFERRIEPTGRTISFRGVTIYDVKEGLIQRETVYMDLATLMVELGSQDVNSVTRHAHMGVVVRATRVATPGMEPHTARKVLALLAVCTALQMTSYGMIFPLFARKVGDFGDDVTVLATSVMAYSLAAAVAAPLMGSLADRLGRRPMILGSFAVFAAAFTAYYVVTTSVSFIVVRGVAGALTAGLGPATMGVVADIAPADERARWIGVIGAATSAGFILGPVVGGLLYDTWGYGPPFLAAIGIALVTVAVAAVALPETHTEDERRRAALRRQRARRMTSRTTSLLASLPRPLLAFGVLLLVHLSMVSAWFFVDPQLPFYAFDDLGWSTAQFGALISVYGWAALVGSLGLARSSDRYGRKPILLLGLVLHAAQYGGLMLTDVYWIIGTTFLVAGVGEALVNPALSAAFLDITPEDHRSRAMGINAAIGSIGSLAAPALAIVAARHVAPQDVFAMSATLILSTALVVLMALRLPGRTGAARDPVWEASQERVMAAQSALHNVTATAATARQLRSAP